jgi:hypothetical protein
VAAMEWGNCVSRERWDDVQEKMLNIEFPTVFSTEFFVPPTEFWGLPPFSLNLTVRAMTAIFFLRLTVVFTHGRSTSPSPSFHPPPTARRRQIDAASATTTTKIGHPPPPNRPRWRHRLAVCRLPDDDSGVWGESSTPPPRLGMTPPCMSRSPSSRSSRYRCLRHLHCRPRWGGEGWTSSVIIAVSRSPVAATTARGGPSSDAPRRRPASRYMHLP